MSLLFKSRQNKNEKQKKSVISNGYFFIVNIFHPDYESLGEKC
jgi:cell division transport system permease protein